VLIVHLSFTGLVLLPWFLQWPPGTGRPDSISTPKGSLRLHLGKLLGLGPWKEKPNPTSYAADASGSIVYSQI
jgi:hypothetical protein